MRAARDPGCWPDPRAGAPGPLRTRAWWPVPLARPLQHLPPAASGRPGAAGAGSGGKGKVRVTRWLLVLPLVSACNVVPWSAGEIDEAFRLCRAEVGFPPISVFEGAERGYGSYMCRCEVDYLAGRVAHTDFASGLHLDRVNRVLATGRTACMIRYRDGDR